MPISLPAAANRRRRDKHCLPWLVACFLLSFLSACTVPGAVRPTVKIGLVAPFEGRYRYVGYDLFPAVRLALQEVNSTGGVEGYAVELVAFDDGADPAMAVQQVQKLALDPQVVAVIGHFHEETTRAVLPLYAETGMALVAPGVLDPDLVGLNAGVFAPGPGVDVLVSALLDTVHSAALVDGGGLLGEALRAAAAERGVRLTPVLSPDEQGWLAAVLEANPPVVLCAVDPVTAGEIIAALRAAGWQGQLLGGPELAAADFVGVAGEAAVGARFVTPWPFPQDAAGGMAVTVGYEQVSGGVPPGPLALPAYEALLLVLDALERDIASDGTPSRNGMLTALSELAGEGSGQEYPLTWYRIDGNGRPEFVSTAP